MRMTEDFESLPLPEQPVLRAWASVLNDAGHWASVLDADWRYVFVTDELLVSYKDMGAATAPPIGAHFWSAEARRFMAETLRGESASSEFRRAWFERGSLRARRYARRS